MKTSTRTRRKKRVLGDPKTLEQRRLDRVMAQERAAVADLPADEQKAADPDECDLTPEQLAEIAKIDAELAATYVAAPESGRDEIAIDCPEVLAGLPDGSCAAVRLIGLTARRLTREQVGHLLRVTKPTAKVVIDQRAKPPTRLVTHPTTLTLLLKKRPARKRPTMTK